MVFRNNGRQKVERLPKVVRSLLNVTQDCKPEPRPSTSGHPSVEQQDRHLPCSATTIIAYFVIWPSRPRPPLVTLTLLPSLSVTSSSCDLPTRRPWHRKLTPVVPSSTAVHARSLQVRFNLHRLKWILPIPVAARTKAWLCGRSRAGIVGSNPA
jgi:hypothetical protein